MATPPNTKILSLCFLFSVLLLFLHVHSSNARDTEAQEELPKQHGGISYWRSRINDGISFWGSLIHYKSQRNEPSPVSKDDSYASQYKVAYTSRKHIHPSHDKATHDSNRPYLTGYNYKNSKNEASLISKDDSYASQYKAAYTFRKHTYPSHGYISSKKEGSLVSKGKDSYASGYKAAYTIRKHVHPSQDEATQNSNQAYLTGYRNSQTEASLVSRDDDSYSGYKAAYTSRKHIHPSQDEASNQLYLTGYNTNSHKDQKEMGEPYITSYVQSKRLGEPYITSYGDGKKDSKVSTQDEATNDSNQSYLTGYINSKKEGPPVSKGKDSYASGYKAAYTIRKHVHPSQDEATQNSNQAYLTGYRNSQNEASLVSRDDDSYSGYKAAYTSRKHIYPSQDEASNQLYLTGYNTNSHKDQKEMGEPYITGYVKGKRLSEPYITSYGGGKKDSKVSTQDEATNDSNQSYLTGYINSKKEGPPVSKGKDSYASGYKAAYTIRKHIHPSQDEATQNSNQAYLTGYGNGKRLSEPYITGYIGDKKDSMVSTQDSKDSYAVNYKVDRTEAFKTGFFALDDLYVGNRMTLQFPINDFAHFLSRKEAESIPFSMSQLPSILQLLSIPEDSHEAQAMRGTHDQCELEPLTGETKVCVSSLESMIDFVRSIISSEFDLDILTSTLPTTSSVPLQNFTILEISHDIYAPKWVACHPLPYPYAVFYCHFISTGSKIFKVQLGSDNGEQMEALGICHLDTSEWSPDHILFKQLGFKPGEAPVCHFFPVKHLMWVPLPSKATM